MPLVPPVTPTEVETLGRLFPSLFNLTLQADLDAIVQSAIDFADSWMAGHLGANYGLSQFTWQVELQRRGQMYLSLEALTDMVKAQKVYGTHFPYMSEESASYEAMEANEWGLRAMQSLDLWVTLESAGKGFALPLFLTSSPIPENDYTNNGLVPLTILYSEILDRARGIVDPDVGTIRR